MLDVLLHETMERLRRDPRQTLRGVLFAGAVGLSGVQCTLVTSLDGLSGVTAGSSDASSDASDASDAGGNDNDGSSDGSAKPGADGGTDAALPTGSLQFWLKADSLTPSSTVSTWTDSSGAGHDAIQSTTGKQPSFVPSGPGGHPVVRFDGVDDELDVSYTRPENDFSFFFVVAAADPHQIDTETTNGTNGTSGQHFLLDPTNLGPPSGAGAGISLGTNGMSVYEHSSNYLPALAVFQGALGTGLFLGELVYEGRRPRLYVNGMLVRQGPASTQASVVAPRAIGAGSSGYGACHADVAEILGYSTALADAERAAVEEYLRGKYGL